MASIDTGGGGHDKGGKKVKQKKINLRVDFTPMVDMNMLLITFFMFCTTLSKPQTMEISMPSKDVVKEGEETKVPEENAFTILLDANDKVYYYTGFPDFKDYTSLKETNFTPEGIRSLLLGRNAQVVKAIEDLKEKRRNKEISEEDFKRLSAEARTDKSLNQTAPQVMIKATDQASYKNLVDALDEMLVCNIGKYAVIDFTEADEFLIKNLETKGHAAMGTSDQQ